MVLELFPFCSWSWQGYCTRRVADHTNLYNSYYQWVSVFLMTQALLFYIPRCLWLSMEGGLMHFLVSGCQGRTIEDSQEKQYKLLVHFEEHVHNKFNKYTFCFFFCELLNLSICALQIYVTDVLLNQQFMDYGYLILKYYSYSYDERFVGLLQENRTPRLPSTPCVKSSLKWSPVTTSTSRGQEVSPLRTPSVFSISTYTNLYQPQPQSQPLPNSTSISTSTFTSTTSTASM